MIDFIKINSDNYPKLVVENQERFALVEDDNTLIGASVIDSSVPTNKIVINVDENHRSNGHGKKLFMLTLEEYKNLFDDKELSFEVEKNSAISIILAEYGAIHIGTDNGISNYILPLN